jgi:adhesin transport system outer membrane protein
VREAAEFLALDAVEAHLEVLRNRDLIRINEDNARQHDSYLARVVELERGGRTDVSSVRQTEARRSQAEANLATARGDLADALAAYEQVVGVRADEAGGAGLALEAPPVAALPAGPEEAAAEASAASPTVLIAAADVDVAAAELRGARAVYYPRADAELAGTTNRDVSGVEGGDSTASALLVLRYNLYRGGADVAREREATQRLGSARSGLEQARREAERDARVSYNALETARARTVALRARVEAQRLARDAYASQFDIGTRDLLDLLDAENELLVSRATLATAEYTERFAVYRVLATVGRMLDTLGVARPPEAVAGGGSGLPHARCPEHNVSKSASPTATRNSQPSPTRGSALCRHSGTRSLRPHA